VHATQPLQTRIPGQIVEQRENLFLQFPGQERIEHLQGVGMAGPVVACNPPAEPSPDLDRTEERGRGQYPVPAAAFLLFQRPSKQIEVPAGRQCLETAQKPDRQRRFLPHETAQELPVIGAFRTIAQGFQTAQDQAAGNRIRMEEIFRQERHGDRRGHQRNGLQDAQHHIPRRIRVGDDLGEILQGRLPQGGQGPDRPAAGTRPAQEGKEHRKKPGMCDLLRRRQGFPANGSGRILEQVAQGTVQR